jgi:hypothetical protein
MTHWDILVPHDLIEIWMDKANPWWRCQKEAVGDLPEVARPFGGGSQISHRWDGQSRSSHRRVPRPQVRVSYSPQLSTSGMRELDHQLWISRSALLDRKYGVRLESPEPDVLSLETTGACLEWRMWALQWALLRTNATFVHAAALERDGKALLFPSWARIGKTALVKRFIDGLGFRLLGDDLVIVCGDGQCYGYPKPMGICAYHKEIYPEFFAGNGGPAAPRLLNTCLTWGARRVKPLLRPFPGALQFARRHNPRVRWVPPSEVFGIGRLASRATVESVVWLDRVAGIAEPVLTPADASLASRIVGSTLNEIDPWCVRVANVAFGLGLLDFGEVYDAWQRVVQGALRNARVWMLYVPESLPLPELPEVVPDVLAREDVLLGCV